MRVEIYVDNRYVKSIYVRPKAPNSLREAKNQIHAPNSIKYLY